MASYTSVIAPLVVSYGMQVPIDDADDNVNSASEESAQNEQCASRHELTMSEFLAKMVRIVTEDESEDEENYAPLPLKFDADSLAHSPSAVMPSTCYVPVLCMAKDEDLPVLMSSLMYQRHVWGINEPLIGVAFSKYETVITLHVGWLDEHVHPGDALVSIAC